MESSPEGPKLWRVQKPEKSLEELGGNFSSEPVLG